MATMKHQVWIDAPMAKVYKALSSAEGFSGWWAPHKSEQTKAGLVISHTPGPGHGDVKMRQVEAEPDRLVEYLVISKGHPPESPASEWTGTSLCFELSRRDNPGAWRGISSKAKQLTVLEFRHSGWDKSSDYYGFCNFCWGLVLNMLKEYCEKKS